MCFSWHGRRKIPKIRYALVEPETVCPGATYCDEECVDLDTDARHCGRCGHACLPEESCEGGSCITAETPPDVPEEGAGDADPAEAGSPEPDAADAAGEPGGPETGVVDGGCGCSLAI
ncbi:MAG: hypothetical protein ABIJ56_01900 [Pseudomonadota bacterium]